MATTVRTTISVPRELKVRMEAAGQGENWSAVACRAFEMRLAEIITQKGAKDMDDVITRLRASKTKGEGKHYRAGHGLGQAWARRYAEADELERLEVLSQKLSSSEWEWHFGTESGDAYGAGEHFLFTIDPDQDRNRDRAAARDFWEVHGGDNAEDAVRREGFVRGFADGALEVWGEVKEKL